MRAAWILSTSLDKKNDGRQFSATRDYRRTESQILLIFWATPSFPNHSLHSTTWYIPSSIRTSFQASICINTFVLSSLSLVLSFSTSCSLCCWLFRSLVVLAERCNQMSTFPIILEVHFRWTDYMNSWILSLSLLGISLKTCKCRTLPAQALLFTASPQWPCGKTSNVFETHKAICGRSNHSRISTLRLTELLDTFLELLTLEFQPIRSRELQTTDAGCLMGLLLSWQVSTKGKWNEWATSERLS